MFPRSPAEGEAQGCFLFLPLWQINLVTAACRLFSGDPAWQQIIGAALEGPVPFKCQNLNA